jgi:hypothetical protein
MDVGRKVNRRLPPGHGSRAFRWILCERYFGPSDSPLRRAGAIFFEEFGGGPGNGYTWVELEDDLTASLLQARLIELRLPINVETASAYEARRAQCWRRAHFPIENFISW